MRLLDQNQKQNTSSRLRYPCAVGGCSSRETSKVNGGISFINVCKRLDSQADTLTRDTTQSPSASCGESSSESVVSMASLNSQASPLPVSPAEAYAIVIDHPICATGKRVQRSSAKKASTKENERAVVTTPFKYEDKEIVNTFGETFMWLSWQWQRLYDIHCSILPFSQSRIQEQLLDQHYR